MADGRIVADLPAQKSLIFSSAAWQWPLSGVEQPLELAWAMTGVWRDLPVTSSNSLPDSSHSGTRSFMVINPLP